MVEVGPAMTLLLALLPTIALVVGLCIGYRLARDKSPLPSLAEILPPKPPPETVNEDEKTRFPFIGVPDGD